MSGPVLGCSGCASTAGVMACPIHNRIHLDNPQRSRTHFGAWTQSGIGGIDAAYRAVKAALPERGVLNTIGRFYPDHTWYAEARETKHMTVLAEGRGPTLETALWHLAELLRQRATPDEKFTYPDLGISESRST